MKKLRQGSALNDAMSLATASLETAVANGRQGIK